MAEFREEYEICRSVLSDLDELAALSEGLHGGLDYLDFVFPHWVKAEEEQEAEKSGEAEGGGRWKNLTLRVRGHTLEEICGERKRNVRRGVRPNQLFSHVKRKEYGPARNPHFFIFTLENS